MIQAAKILEVSTRNFFFIDHVGIMIVENGEPYVYHNDTSPANEYGGNIIRQPLAEFMEGRQYEQSSDVKFDLQKFYSYVNLNRHKQYNLISYNCEHFISEALSGSMLSPQLKWWRAWGSVLTISALSIWGIKKIAKKIAININ